MKTQKDADVASFCHLIGKFFKLPYKMKIISQIQNQMTLFLQTIENFSNAIK